MGHDPTPWDVARSGRALSLANATEFQRRLDAVRAARHATREAADQIRQRVGFEPGKGDRDRLAKLGATL